MLIFQSIFYTEEYRAPSSLKEVQTIIDLGANIGISAVYFSHTHPQAKIIALEPEVSNFRMLELNAVNLKYVVPLQAAIWSHDTECELDETENGIRLAHWAFRSREAGHGGARVQAIWMPTL